MALNTPMEHNKSTNKRNYVRGITIFLGVLLFVPPVKQALDIKLFKIEGGFFGLWQLFVIVAITILLPALMFDRNDKIEIPFLKKFFTND
jgi:hypothetical protein